jgi:hypothetical protein
MNEGALRVIQKVIEQKMIEDPEQQKMLLETQFFMNQALITVMYQTPLGYEGSFQSVEYINASFRYLQTARDPKIVDADLARENEIVIENTAMLLSGLFTMNISFVMNEIKRELIDCTIMVSIFILYINYESLQSYSTSKTSQYIALILSSLCHLPYNYFPFESIDMKDEHFRTLKRIVKGNDLVSSMIKVLLRMRDIESIERWVVDNYGELHKEAIVQNFLQTEYYILVTLACFSDANVINTDSFELLEQSMLELLFVNNEHDKLRRSKSMYDLPDERGYQIATIGKNENPTFVYTFCLTSYRASAIILLQNILLNTQSDQEEDEDQLLTLNELKKWKTIVSNQFKAHGNNYFKSDDFVASAWYYMFCLWIVPDESLSERVTCHSNRSEAFLRSKQWKLAEIDAEEALALDPDHLKSQVRLHKAKRK